MIEKTLYLECYSGISGDMTVAALLDLGADQKTLLDGLNSLKVDGYKIEIGRRNRNGINACDFNVILDDRISDELNHHEYGEMLHNDHFHGLEHYSGQDHHHEFNHSLEHDHHHELAHSHEHDHQHEFDHSHEHDHQHELAHSHEHDHQHELAQSHEHDHQHEFAQSHEHNHQHEFDQSHEHGHQHDLAHSHEHQHPHDTNVSSAMSAQHYETRFILGHHEHRNLHEINHIIEASEITENAKIIAKKIFHIIAVAESKAHAKPLEEVHFHEVGAVDSIVDIVATAICLDNLNIKKVIVSELYEGTGMIECQHGMIPIPAPAVANISAEYHLPLHITGVKGELVTPTGAAIVAAIKTDDALPKEMTIQKIGLGAGKRSNPGSTGILRAMLIEEMNTVMLSSDKVWVLEANLDDCSGEALSYAMELLFQNGARDVYYTPIYMKKNRPAYLLGVICKEEDIPILEGIIFTHTTTIGVRKYESIRTVLPRIQETVSTPYGDAFVKVCTYKDQTYVYPEYESIKQLCGKTGMDYFTMYHEIQSAYQK